MILGVLTACGQEENTMNISERQVRYAIFLRFTFQIVIDGEKQLEYWWQSIEGYATHQIPPRGYNPLYTDLVFVHSEEEAVGFPDSTVVAWPLRLDDIDVAQGIINTLHIQVLRNDIDLAQFGLTYPLIVENLVDDWVAIADLIAYIYETAGDFDFLTASVIGADAFIEELEELRRGRD